MNSPTEAREAVYALIGTLSGATVQAAVKLPLPRGVTVTLSPAGMTPTEYRVRVSVYAHAGNSMPAAIASVEALVSTVDARLTDAPRSEWATAYEPELECWASHTIVDVGREDF